MSERLFQTKGELKKALKTDLRDIKSMKKQNLDVSGISQVIKHKKMMLKTGSWK